MIPILCQVKKLDVIVEESLPPVKTGAVTRLATLNIAGVKADVVASENGEVTTEIKELPREAKPQDQETTGTQTTPEDGGETETAPEGAPQTPEAPQAPEGPAQGGESGG